MLSIAEVFSHFVNCFSRRSGSVRARPCSFAIRTSSVVASISAVCGLPGFFAWHIRNRYHQSSKLPASTAGDQARNTVFSTVPGYSVLVVGGVRPRARSMSREESPYQPRDPAERALTEVFGTPRHVIQPTQDFPVGVSELKPFRSNADWVTMGTVSTAPKHGSALSSDDDRNNCTSCGIEPATSGLAGWDDVNSLEPGATTSVDLFIRVETDLASWQSSDPGEGVTGLLTPRGSSTPALKGIRYL
jgi:hypothetical protein